MDSTLTVPDVSGLFRDPSEPVFSYGYSIERSNWETYRIGNEISYG